MTESVGVRVPASAAVPFRRNWRFQVAGDALGSAPAGFREELRDGSWPADRPGGPAPG
ncbi:hypothetical protein ACFV23_32025 [Streptomyces sp. NPDC059627]